MRYTSLGASGLKVSVLSLGSWLTYGKSVTDRRARNCVRAALEAGVNVLDTADIYNRGAAEEVLGDVLRSAERRHVVLATKAFWPMSDDVNDRGLSRKHLTESLHGSLKRLQTGYVDLYQCHRYDETTPTREVVATMGDLIARGEVLYWGVSMWPTFRIVEACRIADRLGVPRPVSNQPVYNLLDRGIEEEVLPTCRAYGMGQMVFSPLAQGVLTGKYSSGQVPDGSRASREDERRFMERYLTDDVLARVDRLSELAAEAGLTLPQLALAWVIRTDGVDSAIFGASEPEQVEENITAADVDLEEDLLAAIDKVLEGGSGAGADRG